jgi:hypothetical protein
MTRLRLVSLDFLINRLVANREVASDFLGAPMQSKKPSNRLPGFRRDARRTAAAAQSLFRQMLGLPGPIPSSARAPASTLGWYSICDAPASGRSRLGYVRLSSIRGSDNVRSG